MKILRKFCAEQVNILLDRMDTHPEEFVNPAHLSQFGDFGKWGYIITSGEFSRIEKILLTRKIKALRRKATHQQILTNILYASEETDAIGPYVSTVSRFQKAQQLIKDWAN